MKAFPRGTSAVHEGMDLRDYFAASALQGFASLTSEEQFVSKEALADCCYEFADALMEARKK